MPELPEVEAFKRYFENNCLHNKIEKVKVNEHKLLKGITSMGLGRKLKNKHFTLAERYGKYLFAGLNGIGYLMFHFGMTGSLECFKIKNHAPDFSEIFIYFNNNSVLSYKSKRKLGFVKYIENKSDYIQSKKLGPDALSVSGKQFEELVDSHQGIIKSFLMNQKIIAGIGNEYSDEILFHARIHPQSSVNKIEAGHLYTIMKNILSRAVEITINGQNFPDDWLIRNRSEDNDCPVCAGKINKLTINSRSSYFCPGCQHKY